MTIFLGTCLILTVLLAGLLSDMKARGDMSWHQSALMAVRMVAPWSVPLAIIYAMLVASGFVEVCR